MRIALVTTEFVSEWMYDGGLANYLMRLALSLIKMGHTPVVFVTTDHNEVIEYRGIEVHRVDAIFKEIPEIIKNPIVQRFYRSFLYISNSYKLNVYIRKIHRHKPFDLIQYTHLMGLGLFRPREIPSIIRLSSFTQACMDAYEIKGYRQQHVWEELAMKRMDGLFGPSKLVGSILSKRIRRNIRVIESPFLIDVEIENPLIYQENLTEKKYLLFFGTVGLLKGVGSIAKILNPLFEKYSDVYFAFVGKDQGTPDGQPFVPILIDSAGVHKDRVLYLGKLRHEELYPIIRHAHAVVLPSRIDNFPNTCIEAMAHKKVVIGTRGTSFEQLIDEGVSGFLCEIDNEQSLMDTIDEVMRLDENQLQQIGNKAWDRIQTLHPDIVVNQLVDFYKEIIAKKKSRRTR